MNPLLSLKDLTVEYAIGGRILSAVSNVSLGVDKGETLGLVGESGCGKSTLGRAVLQLRRPTSGKVTFDGTELTELGGEAMRLMRRRLQLIFQDPIASLNPRRCVGDIVAEPLIIAGVTDRAERERRVREVLTAVGLDADLVSGRLPHEFSGGQCQRISIARALILEPQFVICDEPVSALDVTIQAQILDLLAREQQRRHMAMILITHDLGVVAGRTDEVAVMYAGRVVERAPTPRLFANMRMPYTEALLAALPKLDSPPHTALPAIAGRPPDPTRPMSGCSFAPRCRYADDLCARTKPPLEDPDKVGALYACWHPLGQREAVSA